MIAIVGRTSDAPEFLVHVATLANGVCRLAQPPELYAVRVEDWFDAKWLDFAAKWMGALSVW